MNVDFFEDSPYYSVISFHKVVEALQEIAKEKTAKYRVEYANSLLKEVEKVPELYQGITSKNLIYENIDLIHNLLADLFPTALSNNEIKAVSLPFQNFNFNFTKRFQQILADAGETFQMNIRDFTADEFYILSCCMILNIYYNENFDISRSLFYDIPDKYGIIKHYRITYNADFVEIIPTANAISLTKEDINILKKNYHNVALWKEKFPKKSWILKGFGILTLFDVTTENAISNLKSNLIKADAENTFMDIIERSFQSIFKIPKLRVGLLFLNQTLDDFYEISKNFSINSYFNFPEINFDDELKKQCFLFLKEVENANEFFCVSDIDDLINTSDYSLYARLLKSKNIESFVIAKLNKVDTFHGFIEVVSDKKYALHTINSNKLKAVLPFINDTVDRIDGEIKNQLEAIIQREFTTIHPSVYWKFLDESRNYFKYSYDSEPYVINEIEFEMVYPLYGETDIKGSTQLRNEVTKIDLNDQLDELIDMFENTIKVSSNLLFKQRLQDLLNLRNRLSEHFDTNLEFKIQDYISQHIHPILKKMIGFESVSNLIKNYENNLDESKTKYCRLRKVYDKNISQINKSLAEIIDVSQTEAQKIFPHYFERFKSDGIEHNAFIGASISPQLIYDNLYLYNLRLWQIQTMCAMVRNHYSQTDSHDFTIDLTSLILIYNFPIDIRFRYDEKRFDVSSSSDARYQIIKKRIDKAKEKKSNIRIVQPKYLTIVYLNETDKYEYLNYLNFLTTKDYFKGEIEDIEIQDLQDIVGLRALRILINVDESNSNSIFYSLTDMN